MHQHCAVLTDARAVCRAMALLCALAWGCAAQASEVSCLTAGRLDSNGQWAPKFDSVVLRDGSGRVVTGSSKADMKNVQAVEIKEPALLSACVGDRPLPAAEGSAAQPKSPVPAAKPGRLPVAGVGYPQLRSGGVLVEVKVQVSPDQIVMLTR